MGKFGEYLTIEIEGVKENPAGIGGGRTPEMVQRVLGHPLRRGEGVWSVGAPAHPNHNRFGFDGEDGSANLRIRRVEDGKPSAMGPFVLVLGLFGALFLFPTDGKTGSIHPHSSTPNDSAPNHSAHRDVNGGRLFRACV